MNRSKQLCVLGISMLITACGTLKANYTDTGDDQFSSLSSDCPVKIYTTQPKKEYSEIGIIDIDFRCNLVCSNDGVKVASFVRDFVRPNVCKAGGNAILLWEANAVGWYTKATVIRTSD